MNKNKSTNTEILSYRNRFLFGLVIALSFGLFAFEYTSVSYEELPTELKITYLDDDLILPPITYRKEEVEKVKKEIKNSPTFEIVKNTEPVEPKNEPVVNEPEPIPFEFNPELYGMLPEKIDDEPEPPNFTAEYFAHYDKCAGLESSELYTCTMQDIVNRIKQNFIIPEELKSESGELSAIMSFRVDKNGQIDHIEVLRTNHPVMGKAAAKAIEKLPAMNPAQQKGKSVNLTLRVPIKLYIEN